MKCHVFTLEVFTTFQHNSCLYSCLFVVLKCHIPQLTLTQAQVLAMILKVWLNNFSFLGNVSVTPFFSYYYTYLLAQSFNKIFSLLFPVGYCTLQEFTSLILA